MSDAGPTAHPDGAERLAERICEEARRISASGGNLQQMILDLLARVGKARAPVQRALELCESTRAAGDERAVQLLRRALATGLFEQ